MKNITKVTEAGRQYATAYESHYTAKDMHKAFVLYSRIIAEHPAALEAEYSRSQIQNIVNSVVSKQEISDALQKLARAHFDQDAQPDVN